MAALAAAAIVHEVAATADPRSIVTAVSAAVDSGHADALVCGAQGHAAQCQIVLEGRGLTLGKELDVVSFAGIPSLEAGNPRITAIDLAARKYGAAATELLDAAIRDTDGEPIHRWFDGAGVLFAH